VGNREGRHAKSVVLDMAPRKWFGVICVKLQGIWGVLRRARHLIDLASASPGRVATPFHFSTLK
jgi:hypothetical protein